MINHLLLQRFLLSISESHSSNNSSTFLSSLSLSEKLVELSREAGCFKESVFGTNKKDVLTMRAGGYISDMKCNCLVSMEKMPLLIIASVLFLCFEI